MVMQVMMTMGPCFWGGRRPSWHPQCSPHSASYSPSWEQGLAWPSPCLLYFIQYKQPPGGAFSVSWPHTHTHTHTHTHKWEPNDCGCWEPRPPHHMCQVGSGAGMLEVRVRKPRGCKLEPVFQRSSLSGTKATSGLDFFLFLLLNWADSYMECARP